MPNIKTHRSAEGSTQEPGYTYRKRNPSPFPFIIIRAMNTEVPLFDGSTPLPLYQAFSTKRNFKRAFPNPNYMLPGVFDSPVLAWSTEEKYARFQDKKLGSFFVLALKESLPYLKDKPYLVRALLSMPKFAEAFLHKFLSKPECVQEYPEFIPIILALPHARWKSKWKEDEDIQTPLIRLGKLLSKLRSTVDSSQLFYEKYKLLIQKLFFLDEEYDFSFLKENSDFASELALLPEEFWLERDQNNLSRFSRLLSNSSSRTLLSTKYRFLLEKFLKFSDEIWDENVTVLSEEVLDDILRLLTIQDKTFDPLPEQLPAFFFKRLYSKPLYTFFSYFYQSPSLFIDLGFVGYTHAYYLDYSYILELLSAEIPYNDAYTANILKKLTKLGSQVWGLEATSILFPDPHDTNYKEVEFITLPSGREFPHSNDFTTDEEELSDKKDDRPKTEVRTHDFDSKIARARRFYTSTPLLLICQPMHISVLALGDILCDLAELPTKDWEHLASAGIFAGTSPLYTLSSYPQGMECFGKEPLLIDHLIQMTDQSWISQKKYLADKGATCLYWFLRSPIGKELLKTHPQLWERVCKLPIPVWNLAIEEGIDRGTTPLYWLCREVPELLIATPELFKNLTRSLATSAWQVSLQQGPNKKTASNFLGDYTRSLRPAAPSATASRPGP